MSRTLTAAVTVEVGKAVTAPGYLVEIGFATPLQLCSRGTLTWLSTSWQGWDIKVQGLTADAQASDLGGTLILGNTDNTLSALILGEGIAQRTVRVWAFWGAAPADADPVQLFAGVADAASFDPDGGLVTLQLVQANARALFAPRLYVTPEQGFSFLPAPGSIIEWDGERYQLQAEA